MNQISQIDWQALFNMGLPWIVVLAAAAITFLTAALTETPSPPACPEQSRRVGEGGGEGESNIIPLLALAAIVVAFAISWQRWLGPSSATPMLGMLIFDRLAFFVWLVIFLACALCILLSIPYLSSHGASKPEYYGLLLLSTFGMGCLVSAGDLLMVYLGIETMSLAVYVLAGFLRARQESNEAALKYFLIGAFASAFLLMGIAFIFGSAGTTNLSILASRSSEILSGEGRSFYLFGIAMLLVGFGFKVAAVPFHAWAPDVYDGAPTPITTFMATAVKAAAFIAFYRVSISVFKSTGEVWIHVLTVASIITMFVGNLAAIVQENIKRMLAYSSIAHAGYIMVVFPSIVNDPQGAGRAILFYLFAYVLMTAGAFAVVVAMDPPLCKGRIGGVDLPPLSPPYKGGEFSEISRLAGLGRRRPFLAAALSLFLVSLLGIPPTIGFFGKYYLFLTAVKSGFIWLVVIAVINSALSAYYYLRPIVVMYFTPTDEALPEESLNPAVVAVLAITSLGVTYFGLFPSNLLAIVSRSF